MSDANDMFSTLFEISKKRVSTSSENPQGFYSSGADLGLHAHPGRGPGCELGLFYSSSRQITESWPEASHRRLSEPL